MYDMRQLIIALFLVILVAIGSYYLVTQKLNLNRYFPPTSIQFPELHVPRPLTPITPGPKLTAIPGFASTPTPKPFAIVHPGQGFVPHTAPMRVPLTIVPAAALAVTPPPAPAYHVVTPLPMVPVYPAVILNPSPSPTP
jgi:hypothetical protein